MIQDEARGTSFLVQIIVWFYNRRGISSLLYNDKENHSRSWAEKHHINSDGFCNFVQHASSLKPAITCLVCYFLGLLSFTFPLLSYKLCDLLKDLLNISKSVTLCVVLLKSEKRELLQDKGHPWSNLHWGLLVEIT